MEQSREHYQSERLDSSLHYVNLFIQACPDSSSGYFRRALIYDRTNKYDEAFADYTKAISLEPKALYYNNRAILHLMNEAYAHAVSDLDNAIKSDPDYCDAYMNRAVAKYYLGRISDACADARLAEACGNAMAVFFLEEECP